MVSRAPKGRSKVTNGRQLFIDGDARLKVSRRFRDVLASIATDLGGADRLSEGQKQIARRCAMLSVECEIMESAAVAGQPFDLDAYGQLTDRLGRAFQRLGLKRVMHDVTPDLGAYLTATGSGKPQDGLGAVAASDTDPQPERPPAANVVDRRHDAFRHHAPGPERQASLGRGVGRRQLARLARLAHRRHGRGFDGRRAGDLRQAHRPRAGAGRAGRRIVVRHRPVRRQIESIAALLVYLATMVDYGSQLVLGERGVVLCLARTQEQSQVVLEYVAGVIEAAPILAKMVIRRAADSLTLFNRGATIVIAVRAASFRTGMALMYL